MKNQCKQLLRVIALEDYRTKVTQQSVKVQ